MKLAETAYKTSVAALTADMADPSVRVFLDANGNARAWLKYRGKSLELPVEVVKE